MSRRPNREESERVPKNFSSSSSSNNNDDDNNNNFDMIVHNSGLSIMPVLFTCAPTHTGRQILKGQLGANVYAVDFALSLSFCHARAPMSRIRGVMGLYH